MSQRLQGKIAVITGGNSGIGLGIAQRFVAEGAFVFVTGRRQKDLDDAVALLGGSKNAIGVQGDVSKVADLERLFATVKSIKGRLDVVVANAGVAGTSTIDQVSEEHYNKIFDTNVKGLIFTVQKSLSVLVDGGSIILVGSAVSGKAPGPGFSVYAATKAAVRSLGRGLAVDLKPRKIRVNVLSPGPIVTPMLHAVTGEGDKGKEVAAQFAAMTVLGRLGQTEEIAAAALFLATSDSSYTTGADLVADGGWSQV